MKIINNHAPLKKFTVKAKCAPWIDTSLKNLMAKRDEAKMVAVLSCSTDNVTYYFMLRNQVTKMNRMKKDLTINSKCLTVVMTAKSFLHTFLTGV